MVNKKKHIWYIRAEVIAPAMVWVSAETKEEAIERFEIGAWHKVIPDFDHCILWKALDQDYAITKGPKLSGEK